jgi:uncharacterized damage-inducible protein DinB
VSTDRTDPPYGAHERASYDAWLEYHRATLLLKCDGLDGDQLRSRPVASSLMSLHGLVRHMAEVERNWFRKVIAGEQLGLGIWWDEEHPDGDFEIDEDDDFAADLAVWREQVALARAIAAAHDLDDTGTRRDGDVVDLRWVYVHMIEEYARHNGHADLLRELIDGATGE